MFHLYIPSNKLETQDWKLAWTSTFELKPNCQDDRHTSIGDHFTYFKGIKFHNVLLKAQCFTM